MEFIHCKCCKKAYDEKTFRKLDFLGTGVNLDFYRCDCRNTLSIKSKAPKTYMVDGIIFVDMGLAHSYANTKPDKPKITIYQNGKVCGEVCYTSKSYWVIDK